MRALPPSGSSLCRRRGRGPGGRSRSLEFPGAGQRCGVGVPAVPGDLGPLAPDEVVRGGDAAHDVFLGRYFGRVRRLDDLQLDFDGGVLLPQLPNYLIHFSDDIAVQLARHGPDFQIESAEARQLARPKRMPPFDRDDVDVSCLLPLVAGPAQVVLAPALKSGYGVQHLLDGVFAGLDLHRGAAATVGGGRVAPGHEF